MMILPLFSGSDLKSQPRYLIEIDSKDGLELAQAYNTIKTETIRGQRLSEFPLEVIALIYDLKALDTVRKNLINVPHRIIPISDLTKEAILTSCVEMCQDALFLSKTFVPIESRFGIITTVSDLLQVASLGWFPIEGACEIKSEGIWGRFEKRPYTIRPARQEEIPILQQIEASNWPEGIRTKKSQIEFWIQNYPEGQLVVEDKEGIQGIVYSQKIASVESLYNIQSESLHELYQENGSLIQLIAIFIRTEKQNSSMGVELLEFVLHKASITSGITQIVGLTRCVNYPGPQVMSMEAYLEQRNEENEIVDPVPRMHVKHGAKIDRLVPNYRPKDIENNGYGILIIYNLKTRLEDVEKLKKKEKITIEEEITPESIGAFVEKTILDLLEHSGGLVEQDNRSLYSKTGSLMGMGLDSLQLLELKAKLSDQFLLELEPTFFFEYGTHVAITDYIVKKKIQLYNDWYYEMVWEASKKEEPLPFSHDRIWVIFEEGGFGEALKTKLEENYQYCILVSQGESFKALDEFHYQINPGSYEDFVTLFTHIPSLSQLAGVLFFWGYDGIKEESYDALEAYHKLYSVAFVNLANVLAKAHLPKDSKLWLINSTVSIDGTFLSLVQSPMNGLCKVVREEYPKSQCTHLATDSVDVILEEIRTPSDEREIAYRNGKRLVNRIIPTQLEKVKKPNFDPKASYLIMGGFKPLGRAMAKWYAERGAKTIILIDEIEKSSEVETEINHLKLLGVEVYNYTVDFNNTVILEVLFEMIKIQLPPLKGVIHSAGIADNELLIHTDWDRLKSIYRLKVAGAWHLHNLTKDLQLDHFILFSTPLADLAPLGKGNHVFGNTFLDALTYYRKNLNLPCLTIKWGPWELTQIVVKHLIDNTLDSRLKTVAIQEAYYMLDELYYFNKPEVVAAKIDWEALINQWMSNNPLLSHIGKKEVAPVSEIEEPIAIIGMACRFPGGADTPEKFWQLFKDGINTVTEIPKERWDVDAYYDPDKSRPGKMYTRFGAFVDNVDQFDAPFFNISPREAQDMDPQQRLSLEVAFEALENAGLAPNSLKGTKTGVFMGVCFNDYGELITKSTHIDAMDDYYSTGNHFSVIPGRISYFLGLNGPSMAIDTACSSSLVSVDIACQKLFLGECDLALAGGVNLILSPSSMINFCKSGMLSEDGKCKTFDAAADGYVRGEGCGILVLKRLKDAKRDRNPILAVILSTAVNQDGASTGLTVPSGIAQEKVIQEALQKAKLNGFDIDYVEAHGTGTSLGDPIEVKAISETYGVNRKRPLLIGSAKTNIGHTEAAAGVAGVMKVVLSCLHQELPKILHFHELNPHIKIDPAAVSVVDENKIVPNTPLRASVSSFGFSGTNSHMIIEQASLLESSLLHPLNVLVFSAKTEKALDDLIQKYLQFESESVFSDICFTAATGRNHERFRAAVVASNLVEMKEKLSKVDFLRGEVKENASYKEDVASYYVEGGNIDWSQWDGKIVPIPNYPFQRKRYWSKALLEESQEKMLFTFNELSQALVSSKDPNATMMHFLSKYLKGIFKISQEETIDPTQGFFDMGMDSNMAVSFVTKIKEALGNKIDLSTIVIFNYPSLAQLVPYLLQELGHLKEEKVVLGSQEKGSIHEPIAIVGVACRYPGNITDLDSFWKVLSEGKDGITEIPSNRWNVEEYYDSDRSKVGKMYVKKGGFIDNFDQFDPSFFKISRKEANEMDPQQRVLLEVCFHALENAGIPLSALKQSNTGVFMGAALHDYSQLLIKSGKAEAFGPYFATGNLHSILAGRISYVFDFRGPTISVDTACSTSLVTTSLAVNYLRLGLCDVALAGGVNLNMSPEINISCCKAGMLSPEGACKAFDASADGYARSEGCGVVVLKRLSDALKDKDPILALIKGSAINQDGASSSLTAPNGIAQEEVIQRALKDAGIESNNVTYIEAHGTGTPLGDPIEMAAINNTYGKNRNEKLFVGTVKTNIGHSEIAAGIAGIVKIILSMKNEFIPKNLHFKTLNPAIKLGSNIEIVNEDTPHKINFAAVSSFAFSGTNAHMILQSYPKEPQDNNETGPYLLLLSAKTESALNDLMLKYIDFLKNTPETLRDIAYTSQVGRDHFEFRFAIIAKTKEECIQFLQKKDLPSSTGELGDLATRYLKGEKINWKPQSFQKIALPNYPFQKKRYWSDSIS